MASQGMEDSGEMAYGMPHSVFELKVRHSRSRACYVYIGLTRVHIDLVSCL